MIGTAEQRLYDELLQPPQDFERAGRTITVGDLGMYALADAASQPLNTNWLRVVGEAQTELQLAAERKLTDPNIEIKNRIGLVNFLDDGQRTANGPQITELLKEALTYGSSERRVRWVQTRYAAAQLIGAAPLNDRSMLVTHGLHDGHWGVQAVVAEAIDLVPEDEQSVLRNKLIPIVQEGLILQNWQYNSEAIKRILACTPADYRDQTTQYLASKGRISLPDTDTTALESERIDGPVGPVELSDSERRVLNNLMATNPLYRNMRYPSGFKNGYGHFLKDGSDLIVPHAHDRRGRRIVRILEPGAFYAWQKAYLAAYDWRQAGFDHVPIEPIMNYRLAEDGRIMVAAAYLRGLSYGIWNIDFQKMLPPLKRQADRIGSTLVKLGLDHGHLHNNNLIVVPTVTESHTLQQVKLYAIDFDSASVSV